MQGQVHASPAIPLVSDIETRDGTTLKDARLVNFYVDKVGDLVAAVKRPGTKVGVAITPTGPGVSQGLGMHNGHVWGIVDDVLYQYDLPPGTVPPGGPLLPTHTGQQYNVISDVATGLSGIKTQYEAWVIDIGTVTKITDVNYPTFTCAGMAWLDGTAYVVELNSASRRNVIRGSALEDPFTWPPLNFLETPTTSGFAVYICNYLNYVAVFCSGGIQLFYDAGNPTGIPLLPVSNASWLTGCAYAETVVKISDDIYFVSKSPSTGFSVMVLRGLTLSTLSTPAVDRMLNVVSFPITSGQAFSIGGNNFYCLSGLTSTGATSTIVYNLTNQTWTQWTSWYNSAEQGFLGIHCVSWLGVNYMQDAFNGTALLLDSTLYQDGVGTTRGTQQIIARVVTRPYDWGTLKRKFLNSVYLIADTVQSAISIRYSDDDYTTFSNWRGINLSTVKKFALRFGSSRRRSWELLHNSNTSLRLYAMEVEVDKGSES